MKTKHFNLIAVFLLGFLLMTACRKSTLETLEETTLKSNLQDARLENKCQLTFAIDFGGYPNFFHYNNKGLADEWRIDFGTGVQEVITILYDDNNHLSSARWYSGSRLNSTIEFAWTGDLITSEHWNMGGYEFDFINTYNSRGLMTRRATSDGYHTTYNYSPEGNNLMDIIYFMDQPLQSDEYTYNQPNKNPYLAIQGLPYMFLYFNPPQSKWFASSDKFTIYDVVNPGVVLDLDPTKTAMEMTHQNYLSAATYYDNLSGQTLEMNFEYQNCGPTANAATQAARMAAATKSLKNNKLIKPRTVPTGRPGK